MNIPKTDLTILRYSLSYITELRLQFPIDKHVISHRSSDLYVDAMH